MPLPALALPLSGPVNTWIQQNCTLPLNCDAVKGLSALTFPSALFPAVNTAAPAAPAAGPHHGLQPGPALGRHHGELRVAAMPGQDTPDVGREGPPDGPGPATQGRQ